MLVRKLKEEFWATPTVELFVISDSKGNCRCLVRDDKMKRAVRFLNENLAKHGR